MLILNSLLLALAFFSSMQEGFNHYQQQRRAYTLYQQHSYLQAEQAFHTLAAQAPSPKEKASAHFNEACALAMQGNHTQALPLFTLSRKGTTLTEPLRLQALFNEGTLLAAQAKKSSARQEKMTLYQRSLHHFKQVLLQSPTDVDAKINYEIVRRHMAALQPKPPQSPKQQPNRAAITPAGGIGNDVAQRLLEQAARNESSLMREMAQQGKSSTPRSTKNLRDW